MDSQLQLLRRELEAVLEDLKQGTISQAPAGKWNSEQILEHLYLTYQGTNRAATKCLETGKPLASRGKVGQLLRKIVLIDFGYFPPGRKAPERVVPRGLAHEEVAATILPELEKMDASLEACERHFGKRTRILDHPILGPLTSAQWRRFHLVHGRHHARQIRERSRR
jgi:hypothetical protein